jgi:hypothetical protein
MHRQKNIKKTSNSLPCLLNGSFARMFANKPRTRPSTRTDTRPAHVLLFIKVLSLWLLHNTTRKSCKIKHIEYLTSLRFYTLKNLQMKNDRRRLHTLWPKLSIWISDLPRNIFLSLTSLFHMQSLSASSNVQVQWAHRNVIWNERNYKFESHNLTTFSSRNSVCRDMSRWMAEWCNADAQEKWDTCLYGTAALGCINRQNDVRYSS